MYLTVPIHMYVPGVSGVGSGGALDLPGEPLPFLPPGLCTGLVINKSYGLLCIGAHTFAFLPFALSSFGSGGGSAGWAVDGGGLLRSVITASSTRISRTTYARIHTHITN